MLYMGTKLIAFSDGYCAISGNQQFFIKYGTLLAEISEIDAMALKAVILSCPYFHDELPDTPEGFTPFCEWLMNEIVVDSTSFSARIVFIDIFSTVYECFDKPHDSWDDSDLVDLPAYVKMKESIFAGTEYDNYGSNTIGQALLGALCNVSGAIIIANGVLRQLSVGGKAADKIKISPDYWGEISIPCQFTSYFGEVQTVYIPDHLISVILLELSKISENKITIKACQNCGKYFVPESRADEIYCGRISPQNPEMTCKTYGSKKLWYDKLKENEVAKLSRNIYMAKQMLAKRNPDRPEYKEMLDFFKVERKKWQALLKKGEKTVEEYTAWLNQMKAQKVLHSGQKPED